MYKFELGEKAKDKITGFKGIIMARIEYLTGCNQYGISPTNLNKDGSKPDWEYFDENRIEIIGKGIKLNTEYPGFDGILPNEN